MTQNLLPGSVLALPDQAVQRLIKLDNGDAALLYLHLLRRNGLEGLPWPVERKQAALEALQSQGMAPRELSSVPAAPIPEPAPPEYALEDITTALSDKASTFPALCDEVERRLNNIGSRGIAMAPGQTLADLYAYRTPLYEGCADLTVDTAGQTLEESVSAVLRALGKGETGAPAGPVNMATTNVKEESHEIQ